MEGAFTPSGSADTSSDVLRQSSVAAWFNSVENILAGVDDSPRIATATDGERVLGFGSAFGVDVGVGSNGEVYLRGRTGQVDSTTEKDGGTSGAAKPGTPGGLKLTPGLLLLVGLAAFLILR